MIYRELCGEKVSMLGMGCMRLPSVDPANPRGPIDKEAAIAMIRYAYEHGVNYFDTAYVYGGGQSEIILGEALSIYPRDTYFIATKFPGLHPPQGGWTMEHVKATFEEQLKKLNVDYVDFYLLHGIMEMDVQHYTNPDVPLADYFYEQKQAGRIRHFGFSSHATPKLLKELVGWKDYFEFCQIQLNYMDWSLQDAKGQLAVLEEAGLPVIVMEPVRGGKLANLNEDCMSALRALRPDASAASWALRFCNSFNSVKVVLSGMSNMDQLLDNLNTYAAEDPMTDEERSVLFDKVVPSLADCVPCTACRYCCEGCPVELDIPGLISLHNELRFADRSFYLMGLKEHQLPGNCIGCGACTAVCPQGIDIPDVMQKLTERIAAMKR